MNPFRYFLGTRKKQWRFLAVCIALVIILSVYWQGNQQLSFIEMASRLKIKSDKLKEGSFNKLENHLFRALKNPESLVSEVNLNMTRKMKLKGISTGSYLQTKKTTGVSHLEEQQMKDIHTNEMKKEKAKKRESMNEIPLYASVLQNVSYNVHIFYYPWYGNPTYDGKYIHWNHRYLPHWRPEVTRRYKTGAHTPPDDIGSDFYPELGCYSSNDPNTIKEHFKQIRTSGAGVVVVSWYPPDKADEQGIPVDKLIPKLLDLAELFKLKVTLHIEPYKDRNDKTVHEDVVYIIKKYSKHPAFYKYKTNNQYLPLLYIYDSYHTKPEEWANLLKPDGQHTIRGTPYDCIMIALMVESVHRQYVEVGGFDGFYTYFAVNGFTYGSKWQTWSNLKAFSSQSNSIFIPSVGPGYIDTSIRPWNSENTRSRQNGEYYRRSFKAALAVNPPIISITSFNEWHEGTQIEKAVPKSRFDFKYFDYSPQPSDYYLKLTREYVEMFQKDLL